MPNPFSKLTKKKSTGAENEISAQSSDVSFDEEISEVNSKIKSKRMGKDALGRIKKRLRITINRKSKSENSGDDADGPVIADEENTQAKKKKPKKEKKPKVKKEKKPKKAKAKGEKKKFPILFVVIGAVAVAGGVGAFLFFNGAPKPTVDEQFLTALNYMLEEEYDDAAKIYKKLIKTDKTLVKAYIGLADAMVKLDKTEDAVEMLTNALEPCENSPLIQAKIDELGSPEYVVPDANISRLINSYLELADAKVAAGDIDGAIQILTEALESTGNSPIIQAKIDELSIAPESEPATPGSTAPSTVPIVFKDAAFEKMLRIAMDKPTGSISEADLAKITQLKILGNSHAAINHNIPAINKNGGFEIDGQFYSDFGEITSLSDISHFKNLVKLTVAYNAVNDISGIENAEKLGTVGLYFNNISDITPLSKLSELKFLYIYDNQISDISSLSKLTLLEQLWLSDNKINDISAVKNMPDLTELFINNNQVSDISPLAGMKNLGFFYAERNNISDISALKDIASLTEVSFIDNPVSDYSPVSHVKHVNQNFL